jgi:hypothetical protein
LDLKGNAARRHGRAQFIARRDRIIDAVMDGNFHFRQKATSNFIVDFGFRREKPINISWRHVQGMGDVANGRFLETDVGEEPLRDVGDAIIWVLFDRCESVPHLTPPKRRHD